MKAAHKQHTSADFNEQFWHEITSFYHVGTKDLSHGSSLHIRWDAVPSECVNEMKMC